MFVFKRNTVIRQLKVVFLNEYLLFSWFFWAVLLSRRLFWGIGQGLTSLLVQDLNDTLERLLVEHSSTDQGFPGFGVRRSQANTNKFDGRDHGRSDGRSDGRSANLIAFTTTYKPINYKRNVRLLGLFPMAVRYTAKPFSCTANTYARQL